MVDVTLSDGFLKGGNDASFLTAIVQDAITVVKNNGYQLPINDSNFDTFSSKRLYGGATGSIATDFLTEILEYTIEDSALKLKYARSEVPGKEETIRPPTITEWVSVCYNNNEVLLASYTERGVIGEGIPAFPPSNELAVFTLLGIWGQWKTDLKELASK